VKLQMAQAGAKVHIRHCADDADVQNDDEHEHDQEGQFLRLVAEMLHSQYRTGPTAQKCENVQSSFLHSATAIDGSLLVQPVDCEANDAHHDDDAQVGNDDGQLVLSQMSSSCP
jgi:hypothetical protein